MPDKPSLDGIWAKIAHKWRKEIPDIIEIGRWLIEAKVLQRGAKGLQRGDFGTLVRKTKDAGKLPFGWRCAQMYMRIAKHEVLAKREMHFALPACLAALDKLARIPADELRRLIKDGSIHPDLSATEAEDLAQGSPRAERQLVERHPGEQRLKAFREAIDFFDEMDIDELLEQRERSVSYLGAQDELRAIDRAIDKLTEMRRRAQQEAPRRHAPLADTRLAANN